MTRVADGLVDTTVFVAFESGRRLERERLPERITVSVITLGELRAGVLAARDVDSRQRRLSSLGYALSLAPVPVDDRVAEAWAWLRVSLRDLGLRMPVNDSWIAATAVALGVPVVTQDDDYVSVPGLEVIRL